MEQKIEYKATLVRTPIATLADLEDNWSDGAYLWDISINGEHFDFYTGAALPEKPLKALVMESMLEDWYMTQEEDFNEWCDTIGCSSDSIRALDTYTKCQENSRRLAAVIDAPAAYKKYVEEPRDL